MLAWDQPQASQVGGLYGRSGSPLGPIPGSGPRYELVGVRGLCGAAQGWTNVLVHARTLIHTDRYTLFGPPSGMPAPITQALTPKAPGSLSVRWSNVSKGTAPGDPSPRPSHGARLVGTEHLAQEVPIPGDWAPGWHHGLIIRKPGFWSWLCHEVTV